MQCDWKSIFVKIILIINHIALAQLTWVPFKNIVRTMSTNQHLRATVPPLLSDYRCSNFTLQDGLSEWKGSGGLLLVTNDCDLVGMLRLDKYRNYYELSSFVVNKLYRGNRYGEKMLQTVIKTTDMPIWLTCKRDNPAYELYSRHKFETYGISNKRFIMCHQ